MGMLVDGKWTEDDSSKFTKKGDFVRNKSTFRNWIKSDAGAEFPAEPNRYVLYSTRSCPWAHRTLLYRGLKNLEDIIQLELVGEGEQGYRHLEEAHIVPGTDHRLTFLHEVYTLADGNYTGRCTVPTLWDSKNKTIVNNESADIIRMFNTAFNDIAAASPDYCPKHLEDQINEMNQYVYEKFNNGVYRAGFSTDQQAYEIAYDDVFEAMDRMESILSEQRYLCGDQITEADWRAFPTLSRFDNAYHYVFKCNKKRLRDYPNLWAYTRDLYQQPKVADLCYPEALKGGYWYLKRVNPLGTIPKGPDGVDFNEPHDRGRFAQAAE